MASKRVAIILYGADRELWIGSGAKLVVRDLNVESRRILARAELEHPTIDVTLQDLAFDAGQAYGLTIQAIFSVRREPSTNFSSALRLHDHKPRG